MNKDIFANKFDGLFTISANDVLLSHMITFLNDKVRVHSICINFIDITLAISCLFYFVFFVLFHRLTGTCEARFLTT